MLVNQDNGMAIKEAMAADAMAADAGAYDAVQADLES